MKTRRHLLTLSAASVAAAALPHTLAVQPVAAQAAAPVSEPASNTATLQEGLIEQVAHLLVEQARHSADYRHEYTPAWEALTTQVPALQTETGRERLLRLDWAAFALLHTAAAVALRQGLIAAQLPDPHSRDRRLTALWAGSWYGCNESTLAEDRAFGDQEALCQPAVEAYRARLEDVRTVEGVGWGDPLIALDEAVFALFNPWWNRALELAADAARVNLFAALDRVDPAWGGYGWAA
jgi:hypothetical protein